MQEALPERIRSDEILPPWLKGRPGYRRYEVLNSNDSRLSLP